MNNRNILISAQVSPVRLWPTGCTVMASIPPWWSGRPR